MKRLLIMTAALVLAGCGDKGANPAAAAAAQRASDITQAQVAAAGGLPGADVKFVGYSGSGCKDKAKALELIEASKSEDKTNFLKLWAAGMKDETCRGFADGLPAKVDKTEGNLSCVLPADDPQNKQCLWVESKVLGRL